MTMKENQSAELNGCSRESFKRETDSMDFGSKVIYELNDCSRDISPLPLEAKGRDECRNPKIIDDFSMDNENGTVDSPRKENENGLLHHPSGWEKNADSLSSDKFDKDEGQTSPGHECMVSVEGLVHNNGDESSHVSSCSNLFQTETHLFSDKKELDCEPPELEVCYKEIDHHMVKDICVDERRLDDKNLIESSKVDKSRHIFSQPPNDHCKAEGGVDMEFFISEGLEPSLLDNNILSTKQCGSTEDNYSKIDAQGKMIPQSMSTSVNNTAKCCNLEDSWKRDEANRGTGGKAVIGSSEDESLRDRKLPVQEFSMQSSLRYLLYSLDSEVNNVMQLPDQILQAKLVSESPAVASADSGELKEDLQTSSLVDNNCNSSVAEITNGISKNVKEQPVQSGDVHDHEVDKSRNLSDVGKVQCSCSSESVQEQSLIIEDGNSNGSVTSHLLCMCGKGRTEANDSERSPEHKGGEDNDFSTDVQVQLPENRSQSPTDDNMQAVEPNASQHEQKNSGNAAVVNQLQHDKGEMSFSAASLITFSGPIAYSGSLSHRSDDSATSGRSFAFPILQSEWDSSPVRMAKADRRQLVKSTAEKCKKFIQLSSGTKQHENEENVNVMNAAGGKRALRERANEEGTNKSESFYIG